MNQAIRWIPIKILLAAAIICAYITLMIIKPTTRKQLSDLAERNTAEKRLRKLETWKRKGIGDIRLLDAEIKRVRKEYGFELI